MSESAIRRHKLGESILHYYGGFKVCKECGERIYSELEERTSMCPGSPIKEEFRDNPNLDPEYHEAFEKLAKEDPEVRLEKRLMGKWPTDEK